MHPCKPTPYGARARVCVFDANGDLPGALAGEPPEGDAGRSNRARVPQVQVVACRHLFFFLTCCLLFVCGRCSFVVTVGAVCLLYFAVVVIGLFEDRATVVSRAIYQKLHHVYACSVFFLCVGCVFILLFLQR